MQILFKSEVFTAVTIVNAKASNAAFHENLWKLYKVKIS